MTAIVASLGRSLIGVVREIGGVTMLLGDTIFWGAVAPFSGLMWDRKSTDKQLIQQGVASIPIVSLLSFTVGLILGMQTAYNLGKLGAESYMPALVAIAMVQELGPLIASIIISGRVGAAIAAELGTMVVAEEIDALRSMALHPARFLVVPRVVALVVMLPCLAMLANVSGIFGAYLYGSTSLGMSLPSFTRMAFEYMIPRDVWSGLVKSCVFALLISGIGCYKGLTVSGGAEGVGKATTETVVHSIFAIILCDGLFTIIFTSIFP